MFGLYLLGIVVCYYFPGTVEEDEESEAAASEDRRSERAWSPIPHSRHVFLVGAGPGSPGLLTVRAAEVLARADLVLYDQLVPERLLDLAPRTAETDLRSRPARPASGQVPAHPPDCSSRPRPAGKTVVRLKGGDPLIFGRGGEEAEALRAAGHRLRDRSRRDRGARRRGVSSKSRSRTASTPAPIAFVTGHELPNKPGNRLDWKALAAFPGTLAIYMGIARLPVIVGELLKHGKAADTPAAIVERASWGEQRSVFARLADLEETRRNAGLEAPGLILVGEAVAQHARASVVRVAAALRPARARDPAGASGRGHGPQAGTPRCGRDATEPGRDSRTGRLRARSIVRWLSSARANGTGSSSRAPMAFTPCCAGSMHSAATCAIWAA